MLTHSEIDSMDLDSLRLAVAEERGWKNIKPCTCGCGLLLGYNSADFSVLSVPDYPRSWEAAGGLLDSIGDWSINRAGSAFAAFIGKDGLDAADLTVCAEGDSAPEAISRCFLKTRQEKNDDK